MITPQTLPHQLTQNVKLLHKIAIVHEQKVLILKRAATAYSRPNCWDLPGGNSEWPAQLIAPMANVHVADINREIMEETGLIAPANYFFEKKPEFFKTFFEPDKQIYSVICGWKILAVELVQSKSVTQITVFDPTNVKLSSEHTESKWVSLAELPLIDFGGVKGEFVAKIIVAALEK